MILSCQFDIETRSLYAVKWYHGTEEFYRYLPKELPPQQVFPKNGINVNVSPILSIARVLVPRRTIMHGWLVEWVL